MAKKIVAKKDKKKELANSNFVELEKRADYRFKLLFNRFDRVETDIREIKSALGPLVTIAESYDRRFVQLEARLIRLEHSVNLLKFDSEKNK